MTEKYKILAKYIKDLSSETPDAETYIFVKDRISKYQLGIDITSKAIKNKMIEIHTTFKFQDKENNKKTLSNKSNIKKRTNTDTKKVKKKVKKKFKKNDLFGLNIW